MWNDLNLECPTTDLCEYLPQDSYVIEDLRNFVTVLSTSANILTIEEPLFNEMHIFHNIQAKYKRILHCDKCLVYLARVGHCLKKMVILNLSKSYLDLAERFLVGFQKLPSNVSLPSRQQLEYILLRTQAAAKLVCEGITYSRETFCFLIKKLKVGHIIIDLMMAASVTARLNILFKTIAVQLCDMYQKVLVWRYKLKQGSFQWRSKLHLPENLENWLEVSETAIKKPFPMTNKDIEFFKSILKTKTTNMESDSESVIFVDQKNETTHSQLDKAEESEQMTTDDIDYGEVIPRQATTEELCPNLTTLQKKFLGRIIQAQTFRKLEIMWKKASSDVLPKILNTKEKKIISQFLSEIKENEPSEDSTSCKKSKKQAETDASIAGMMLARHLGFTQIQIDDCRYVSDMQSAFIDSTALMPVKTLKKLRILYQHVCQRLQATNQNQKYRKLKKIFRRRIADIKLLKQNGDQVTAKKLTFCTSKVILTLYRKQV